jgi:hypothetical protein
MFPSNREIGKKDNCFLVMQLTPSGWVQALYGIFNHRKSIFLGHLFWEQPFTWKDIRSALDLHWICLLLFSPDCPFAHLMSGDAQTCFGAAHYTLWVLALLGVV